MMFKRRLGRHHLSAFFKTSLFSILLSTPYLSQAADGRADYDLDDDGLIEINDLADLNEIRNNLDGKTLYESNAGCPDAEDGTANGGCIGFELTTDLDFDTNQDGIMDANDDYWNSSEGWNPIGSYSYNSNNPFMATFEGNGYVIRNLFIIRQSSRQGLFGHGKNAVIRNLGLTGPLMSVYGNDYVGALMGSAVLTEIQNVFNTGAVQGVDLIGGLIGYLSLSQLENAFNSGSVSGDEQVGGLVGSIYSSNSTQFSTLRQGLNVGQVAGNSDTGGLVGRRNISTYSVFENSYWATDTSTQATSAGESETNSYVGLQLVILQCAIAANTHSSNSSCVSADGSAEGLTDPVSLFNGWDQALLNDEPLWDFGNNFQTPSMVFNGSVYRDTDGDSVVDFEDTFPENPAAYQDSDIDGRPDNWSLTCDASCIANSGLQLDQFPTDEDVWQDEDLDGLPDSWGEGCDATCQSESTLVLDNHPNDVDNDGIDDVTDTDDNNDGVMDIDADSDGLVDVNSLAELDAMRYQLDGIGLRTSSNGDLDQSGCPTVIHQGVLVKRCYGYELTTDLDFDTNQDGIMDANDDYWNNGAGWNPIGSYAIGSSSNNPFMAIFEGNGYVIRNLFINRSNFSSLFAYTEQAMIRNLGLTGPLMSVSGNSFVGALVGLADLTEIHNVFNTGTVQGSGKIIGGLIGYLNLSHLENAVNSGSVSGDAQIGGVVGRVDSDTATQFSTVRQSLNVGQVTGNTYTGGLVGLITIGTSINSAHSVIENSYWATDASTQTTSAGESEANSYVGLPLATLQCAIEANTDSSNSSCVSADGVAEGLSGPVTLFNGWDQAELNGQNQWDFGDSSQTPSIMFNGLIYRDTDGDSVADYEDAFPINAAAYRDSDNDGRPDDWSLICDANCIASSGLQLDQFPSNQDAWQDTDLDGMPDSWSGSCDATCQSESTLVLDSHLNDFDNDGIDDVTDTDDNNDGLADADANGNGLVDIDNLAELNAMRYQLDGSGLRTSSNDDLDQSGCPAVVHNGVLVKRCHGYELTTDLDFDTNQDGIMDSNDTYWNYGSGWNPIGSSGSNNRFMATFEGNSYVIRNLFINRSGYSGLFGYSQNAVIRNLGLTGPLMRVSGRGSVGALVGTASLTEIHNVFSTGAVQGTDSKTGGLVGHLVSSQLENAVNSGSVSGDRDVGGLVGEVASSTATQFSTVRQSLNVGQVTGNSHTGGLVGYSSNNTYSVFENSYWATDTSTQTTSGGESEANSYVGLPLATLQCAIAANTRSSNSNCVSADGVAEGLIGPVTLFNGWDQAVLDGQNLWDFGNNEQMVTLVLNGRVYRDSDGDSVADHEDAYPDDAAAYQDSDGDGQPDNWNIACDANCIVSSGLQLDLFPNNADAWQDDDLDGLVDSWGENCFAVCQSESTLVFDGFPNDTDNDGIDDVTDTDDNNDGLADADANGNGLVDIDNLAELNAMRYQLDGSGLRTSSNDDLDQSGCPAVVHNGVLVKRCHGYELTTDLDFDTNQDGIMDSNDTYWNYGSGWNPIGSSGSSGSDEQFKATFEGNGYVIRNLFINRSGSHYQGLFGYTQNAVIRNLGLTGPLMSVSGYGNVGALVGWASLTEIHNVFNTGAVQARFGTIGGLIGRLDSSQLENAVNSGSVSGDRHVGGLVGKVTSPNATQFSTVRQSLNVGQLTGNSRTGGLVGYSSNNTYFVFENSYWATDASTQDTSAGESEANSYVGLPLATLQCAIAANTNSSNSGCVSEDGVAEGLSGPVTLFNGWDQAQLNDEPLWDFGNDIQTPSLAMNGRVYRDSDGDYVVDADDEYPLISLDGRPDFDNDGIPNECDSACAALGMLADTDDDNDGVADTNDAYPFISLGGRLDSDNDGIPNECDESCTALGMNVDTDDDNDGVADTNDAYPLIALGERLDTDNDGTPNACDADCLALGMTADLDDDNDGVADTNDAYPLIALGERLDTDNDGIPNACDGSCTALGMIADTDDDNDGVLDVSDVFPLIAIGELADTDNDGAPDACDADCLALGMSADLDDDNDGVLDINDVFPLVSLGGLSDSDGDGIPNDCDTACLELGMRSDLDDDNDGVADTNDAYPLIALGERLDTDNDGIPNACDASCTALGMIADTDDDNDGVVDTNDAYPLIALGERLDTDNDGIPNECDNACEALGMTADLDDDNDGVADTNDAYPLIALDERLDTDNDGTPNACDVDCLALGMKADTDDDNDGLLDVSDVFPLIAIGELTDTDNDGAPDACDADCLALGMSSDLDDDNDGVLDINDAYPLISLGDLSDTDGDGIPNNCDTACLELGMLADTDDDNDGLLDANDAYPLVAIGELLDSDNDGSPDTCDSSCESLGMLADTDDDNDGVLDVSDAYPLIAIGELLDTDNDGAPNTCDTACLELGMLADGDDDNDGVLDINDVFPLDRTEHSDFDNDGLGDVADLDDDNDGVDDINDPNLGADNGAPEIVFVLTIPPVAVTTESGDAYELLVDEAFLDNFQTVDAVDTAFSYEASLNGEVLAIDENDIMLIPAGRKTIQLVAIDTSGNRSEPYELIVDVYPRVRFEQSTSIIGEQSTTNIKVQLTGDSPEYPVVVNFDINELSDVGQNDLDASFDIEAQHQVIIEAGVEEAYNRDGFITIPIVEDNESENNELLIVDLVSAQLASETEGEIESLLVIDEAHQQHELTVTYQNLAPIVQLKLEQDGVEVVNVLQDGGIVSVTTLIQDGNGIDTHTLVWDLNSLSLNVPMGEVLTFNPDNIPAGSYSISVEVIDSGVGNLTDVASIEFEVVDPTVEPENREGQPSGGGGGGGPISPWFMLLLLLGLYGRVVRK